MGDGVSMKDCCGCEVGHYQKCKRPDLIVKMAEEILTKDDFTIGDFEEAVEKLAKGVLRYFDE